MPQDDEKPISGSQDKAARRYPSKHPLYETWRNMKRRCESPRFASYRYYGGCGIKVCDRWQNFWNWLDDMGPRPGKEYRLIRDDLAGDFEPGNARWALRGEEGRKGRGRREFALRYKDKVSKKLGSLHEALYQKRRLEVEATRRGREMALEVVWRVKDGEWRPYG